MCCEHGLTQAQTLREPQQCQSTDTSHVQGCDGWVISSSSGYTTGPCWVLDSRLARPWVQLVPACLQSTESSLPAHHSNWGAGRRHRATTYQVLGCLQQLLVITDLRSCPWASGDRFSKAVPLVWEKQLVKEFPESELLSLLASLGFPDEKAWPKPSWTRLLFSWLSFDLDELV